MTTLDPAVRYALLVYDIPARINLNNPSSLLRRFGARINLSCWVLPLKNLPLVPLKEWVEKGATVEVIEFDEGEREKVIALARKAIFRDLDEMRAFIEKLLGVVRSRFAASYKLPSGSQERADAVKKAEGYAYAALYRAKGIADAAEEAALYFDLTGDVATLVDGLRKSIKAKSVVFYSMQVEARDALRGPFLGESVSDAQVALGAQP